MRGFPISPILLGMAALATAAPLARAQTGQLAFRLEASVIIAAVESEGTAHPRPEHVRPYAPYAGTGVELLGGPERRCVAVPRVLPDQPRVIRSGEFVIGGHLPELEAGRSIKLWWKPLAEASMEMRLDVRGWRLDAADETAVIEIGGVTAPTDSHTREFYEDEASFLGRAEFPSAGSWIVVGRTGRSWGCFLFSVPERR